MDPSENGPKGNHRWQHGVRALGALTLGIAALSAVVAMLLHDFGVKSFLDRFFGSWSDVDLTLLAGTLILLALAAVKALERGHSHSDVKVAPREGGRRD